MGRRKAGMRGRSAAKSRRSIKTARDKENKRKANFASEIMKSVLTLSREWNNEH